LQSSAACSLRNRGASSCRKILNTSLRRRLALRPAETLAGKRFSGDR
jgi:hypothetical protein